MLIRNARDVSVAHLSPYLSISTLAANTLLVMNYVLNALHSSRKVNIRSIYYQNVNAFKKQSNVEEILQRISHVLGIRRESLNVRASHKGLFLSSALSIQLCNGNVLNGSDSVANYIPTMEDIHQVDVVCC